MMAEVARLSGTDWEDWANQLLARHYGPTNYQRVPASDRGDAGIEGFCLSDRAAFQCYGCEEPIGMSDRLKRQQVKMTTDIGKFVANKDKLAQIFGNLKLERWVFFVPYFDSKEIVAHAAKKSEEVIEAGLPYVGDGFRVLVSQESDYSVARDQLLSATPQGLKFLRPAVTPNDVSIWSDSNDSLLNTLKDKLTRLPHLAAKDKRDQFLYHVLQWYLAGQSVLDALREYPDIYEKVLATKSHREAYLAMNALSGTAGNVVLQDTLKEFRATLKREASELHEFCAESLAYEAVADWLMRCPLEFPEIDNA